MALDASEKYAEQSRNTYVAWLKYESGKDDTTQ